VTTAAALEITMSRRSTQRTADHAHPRTRRTLLAAALMCATALQAGTTAGEPVAVRHKEGVVHGFLVLRTLDGTALADGDLIQVASGDRVTARLVFHFKDGSTHDETAVFSQRQRFRLVSDHLVQKGPAFPQPLDLTIDPASGQATVRYTEKDGTPKTDTERLALPPDLANGMILTLLKNVRPESPTATISMVAATPKPRLVKIEVTAMGEEQFATGGEGRKAMHYRLKVDIGGLSGLLAPLLGKQPPDSQVWILEGEAPAFVKSEQPLYVGGPLWRIELVSPVWPKTP
jgi:hypothetical protein